MLAHSQGNHICLKVAKNVKRLTVSILNLEFIRQESTMDF